MPEHLNSRGKRKGAPFGAGDVLIVMVALGLALLVAYVPIATGWAQWPDRFVGLLKGAVSEQAERPAEAAAVPTGTLAELVVDDDSSDVPAYDRDLFGPAWADVDHNGCDQRNDALAAAMTEVTFRAGTHDCVVETGTFTDPYTGQTRGFVKGSDGGSVDIDHLVPLEAAWRAGAWSWTDEQRAAYANDLTLLVPTDASVNRSKGSQDPTTWMPPAEAYRCTYLERWVGVKATWGLSVTSAERDVLSAGLASCS